MIVFLHIPKTAGSTFQFILENTFGISACHTNHTKHCFVQRQGYKLVRRTGFNNWYVPVSAPYSMPSLSTLGELFRLCRKMWFAPPFNNLQRKLRERRYARQNQDIRLGRPTK
jgi:hypothetical protein